MTSSATKSRIRRLSCRGKVRDGLQGKEREGIEDE